MKAPCVVHMQWVFEPVIGQHECTWPLQKYIRQMLENFFGKENFSLPTEFNFLGPCYQKHNIFSFRPYDNNYDDGDDYNNV